MAFASLKISHRLGLAFGVLVLFMLALVLTSAARFVSIKSQSAEIIERDWVNAEAANAIDAAARDDARSALKLFTEPEKERRDITYRRIDANKQAINEGLAVLRTHVGTAEGKKLIEQIESGRDRYQASLAKAAKMLEEYSGDDAVKALENETFPALDALLADVKSLIALQKKQLEDNGAEAAAGIQTSLLLMSVLGIASLIAGIGSAVMITRSITKPLHQAVRIAETVAKGDLSARVSVSGRDETAQLLMALAEMNRSLASIVGKVRSGADAIAQASSAIAHGNAELSQRSFSQASSLQQTAASMEELTTTVQQNADNAQQASGLAATASQIATEGGAVVGEVVETMDAIKSSSRRIVDIISVIDGIAFQTNILALNAAVEAARAGEQGRGFAVVAAEVRNLAQRCTGAAKEIKELITDTVGKVDGGARQVDRAGATMNEIVLAIKRVADIVNDISAASQEQRAGIEQISQAIANIDRVTSESTSVVESATKAAEDMQGQATELAKAVTVFRLTEAGETSRASALQVAHIPPATRSLRSRNMARLPG